MYRFKLFKRSKQRIISRESGFTELDFFFLLEYNQLVKTVYARNPVQVRSDAVTVTSEHMQCHLVRHVGEASSLICKSTREGAWKLRRGAGILTYTAGVSFAVHEGHSHDL